MAENEYLDAPIEKEMQSSYLDYAMSVIIGRALPDARDGLKPAQRRILWAMYGLGNLHDQPTKKSARIVGECFAKDTMVLSDKGLIPIQNIEKGYRVYTQDGLHKVLELYTMPKRKLIKVKLRNGTQNIITESQQLKILTTDWDIVWKEAKDLEYGDYILTKSFYPDITEYVDLGEKKLNENIAYLLGQWLSDGFILMDNSRGKYHRIGFCSASIEIIKAIELCLRHEFNYVSNIEEKHSKYLSTDGQPHTSKIYQIRVNIRGVCDFFIKTFDLLGRKALTKRIPKQIFTSPKPVIFALLSGLFDGDGHIHKQRDTIEYATVSSEMAHQLMVLLQHLDIHGVKYELKIAGERYILGRKTHINDSFSLEFSGVNAQRLASVLNLRDEEKRRRITKLLIHPLKKSNYDIIPWAGEKIFGELSNLHIGGGWYQDHNGKKFRAGVKYITGKKIKYSSGLQSVQLRTSQIIDWGIQNKLDRIGSKFAPFINSIIRDKINFSQVVAIEDSGEDVTYDISVEDRHELVANGMVVHNCIGKFHPHGDQAAYATLIRMAQPFSMNHTLVEGQGNMGSLSDPPAAQRYTEVRLNKLAEEMLADIDKKSVPFAPNFDNTEEEPLILPAKVPNLLINGAAGIAVGVATNIMQHNLREVCDAVVAYVDNQEITPQELLQYIKGPDFPTGGTVFYSNALVSSYLNGRGSCTIRGKTVIEEQKNRNSIIIKEIPYTVSDSSLIQKIASLVKEKRIQGISDLRDESGREGIRIVIELRKDTSADSILNMLYRHTQLQVTIPVMNIAVIKNSLLTLNLKQFIKVFVDHRVEVIKARTKYDLDVAADRLHIVEGLLVAIANINEVIGTIKKSSDTKEARANLIKAYGITEKQANAILDMKLSKLTSLESTSLEGEKTDLTGSIKNLKEILENESRVFQIIKDETNEIKEKYGRERRTVIENNLGIEEIENEDLIVDDETTVILTKNSYMKRMLTNVYKSQGRGGKGVIAIELREGDFVKQIASCKAKDYLLILTSKGRAYWLKAYQVPEANRYSVGKPAVNLVKLVDGETVEKIVNTRIFSENFLTFITRKGTIKRVKAESFSKPRASGIIAVPINQGDSLADACISDGSSNIFIATRKGKALRFNEKDIRTMGRNAHGVRGIRLAPGDEVVNVLQAKESDFIATITENGFGKVTKLDEYRLQRRGGKGVINLKVKDKTGTVVKSLKSTESSEILLINSKGLSIQFPVSTIRVTGRSASGVRLMRVDRGSSVVDAQIL